MCPQDKVKKQALLAKSHPAGLPDTPPAVHPVVQIAPPPASKAPEKRRKVQAWWPN